MVPIFSLPTHSGRYQIPRKPTFAFCGTRAVTNRTPLYGPGKTYSGNVHSVLLDLTKPMEHLDVGSCETLLEGGGEGKTNCGEQDLLSRCERFLVCCLRVFLPPASCPLSSRKSEFRRSAKLLIVVGIREE